MEEGSFLNIDAGTNSNSFNVANIINHSFKAITRL